MVRSNDDCAESGLNGTFTSRMALKLQFRLLLILVPRGEPILASQAMEGVVAEPPAAEPGAGGTARGTAPDPKPRAGLKQLLADKPRNGERQQGRRLKSRKEGAAARNEKSCAATPVEEAADESKADGEVIGGLPTLREAEPLAASPDDVYLGEQGAFDEWNGKALPLDKVKKAGGRELDKMLEHSVKKDITRAEAKRLGLKIVRSRWVDGWKPLPDDPRGVRSRCMAQEVNVNQRDDVASRTPPLKAHRMVTAPAATQGQVPGATEIS